MAAETVPFLHTLATTRLQLLALPRQALAALHRSQAELTRATGIGTAPRLLDDETRRALARKLSRMQDEPEAVHVWHTFWLVVKADRANGTAVGLVGFKGAPDEAGAVEIAYSIAPAYRGEGYATEAARALIWWAFLQPGCRAVVAPVTPRSNAASNRVLEKLGMRVYAATARTQSWRLERAP